MITRTIQISLLSGLLMLPAAVFSAPAPVANTETGHTIMDALKDLEGAHFRYIEDIKETKKGVFEVEALDSKGEIGHYEINFNDPGKTTVPSNNEEVKYLTSMQVAQAVNTAGYTNISRIHCEHTYYAVTAVDMNGSKVKLHVNSVTGEIKKGGWGL